jgi:hypothetical protein
MIVTMTAWPPRERSLPIDRGWEIRPDDGAGDAAPRTWGDWKPARVPAAWQHVLGTGFHGVAWYRVPLDARSLAPGRRDRAWLRFESVATECRAWLDGTLVGGHVGDYVPFQLELPPHARAGELVVRVDELRAEPPAREGDLQAGHITKGFHDVISLQHGGIWQPVHLAVTGPLCAIPDGVAIRADPATGRVRVEVELEPGPRVAGAVDVELREPGGRLIAGGGTTLPAGARAVACELAITDPLAWSPSSPVLYGATIVLRVGTAVSERHDVRFGFRALGTRERTILLNDEPVFLRGVLDWGHEPVHIAPAPTVDEVRSRFARLREMGFNLVCFCMLYPPRYVHEIADETGMLIWQEHPVWQSPMPATARSEYRRLYRSFMRRDRNHPSVAIVSGACEHPSFDAELADWWWRASAGELPGALRQVQTAFFRWTDPARTDLWDEHTYDNSNRWVAYVRDVGAHLRTLPAKPFVMGETVLFTSWPDVAAIDAAGDDPWWRPRALADMRRIEETVRDRQGDKGVARLRSDGDRFHLLGRKFQVEQFRRAGHAGLVMNHLRDVPACQCGFMDDLGRWRFDPGACRGWLGDTAILLATPDERRGFATSEGPLRARIVVANGGCADFDGAVRVQLVGAGGTTPLPAVPLACPRGALASSELDIPLPAVTAPTMLRVEADAEGMEGNAWDLWVFPRPDPLPDATMRAVGMPIDPDGVEGRPEAVEAGYSRGWGLPVADWRIEIPDPGTLVPDAAPWAIGSPVPASARVIVTHRLTGDLLHFAGDGGRVLLVASKAAGGLGTAYEWLFGAVPSVHEGPLLAAGDRAVVVDLLGYDLTRRRWRLMELAAAGLEPVEPVIRLLSTHDRTTTVRRLDAVAAMPVGGGWIVASALDHADPPGRWLLHRLLDRLGRREALAATVSPERLRSHIVERGRPDF